MNFAMPQNSGKRLQTLMIVLMNG